MSHQAVKAKVNVPFESFEIDEDCPACGSDSHRVSVGKGPHAAMVRCSKCDRWSRWMSKSQLLSIVRKATKD
jgi:endogenous inhibitor of DNA gyrase (YacG/DUF329 family)